MFEGHMDHYTLTIPTVDNQGRRAEHYASCARAGLLAAGIDGWTEVDSCGVWRGRSEPGIVFHVYRPADEEGMLQTLGHVGREAAPDQEAIQVTYHGSIYLQEA